MEIIIINGPPTSRTVAHRTKDPEDLKIKFPDMRGFSFTNLKYCKLFLLLYNSIQFENESLIRPQPGDELINSFYQYSLAKF